MRNLKFRVWFKEENSYLQNYDGDNFFDYNGKLLDLGWFIKCAEDPNDGRFIVEQWTGYKDEEGIDVYEGDVVSYADVQYQIIFDLYSGMWTMDPLINDLGIDYSMEVAYSVEESKIVGNIHV